MLKGFTHARLACGCRITFREGVEGSPVTVVVDQKSPECTLPRPWSDSVQAGDFWSTTTVTGLPSTPSRNVMRQPQASRAWVKPFNIAESYHANDAPAQKPRVT